MRGKYREQFVKGNADGEMPAEPRLKLLI